MTTVKSLGPAVGQVDERLGLRDRLGDRLDDLELGADLSPRERGVEVDPDPGRGVADDPAPPTADSQDRSDVELGVVAPHLGQPFDLVHREELDQFGIPLAERLGGGELFSTSCPTEALAIAVSNAAGRSSPPMMCGRGPNS